MIKNIEPRVVAAENTVLLRLRVLRFLTGLQFCLEKIG
jgi:hypothetical protein